MTPTLSEQDVEDSPHNRTGASPPPQLPITNRITPLIYWHTIHNVVRRPIMPVLSEINHATKNNYGLREFNTDHLNMADCRPNTEV